MLYWLAIVYIRLEHFSYAPHVKDFILEILASLLIIRPYATVSMVETVDDLEQYAMPNGPTIGMVSVGNDW